MKFSVSSYSFTQYINAGKLTHKDCIAKAKELGFDGIEFTTLPGGNKSERINLAKELRAEAEKNGIAIVAYAVRGTLYQETDEGSRAEVARLYTEVDIAKELGAPILRHDVVGKLGESGRARAFDLMLPVIADNARCVTEYAETLGIHTCSENHGYIAQDSERMEKLFCAVGHDNFGLLVDIGNFVCVDEDPVAAVARVAPYAVHVHAKDMYLSPERTERCRSMTRGARYFGGAVIGDGDIPVRHCLSILSQAGYDGWISIEYEGAEDCIAGISRGLANLKSYV